MLARKKQRYMRVTAFYLFSICSLLIGITNQKALTDPLGTIPLRRGWYAAELAFHG